MKHIKIKEKLSSKEFDIKASPEILRKRFYKLLTIAVLTFIVGSIFMLIGFGTPFVIMIIFWLTSFSAAGLAVKYKYDLEHKGYKTIEGIVTYKKELFNTSTGALKKSSLNRAFYYHIKCNTTGKLYRLDVTKGNEDLPLKSKVCLYYPPTALETNSNGITIVSPIWAYEILGESDA